MILPYAEVIDPETLNLGLITEEAFVGILNYAKTTYDAKIEFERLAKIEQEEKTKAEAEEKEKFRLENEKLRAEALQHSKEVMQKQKEASELKAKADELLAKKNAELKAISDKMKKQEIVIEKIVEKEGTQKDELQLLKEKYAIAKTSLEAVLFYIVPDDCRKMVYNALDELKNKTK